MASVIAQWVLEQCDVLPLVSAACFQQKSTDFASAPASDLASRVQDLLGGSEGAAEQDRGHRSTATAKVATSRGHDLKKMAHISGPWEGYVT